MGFSRLALLPALFLALWSSRSNPPKLDKATDGLGHAPYDYAARGPAVGPSRTKLAFQSGVGPGLHADVATSGNSVTVKVETSGVLLVDPQSAGAVTPLETFLSYRLDGNQPISTANTEWEFANVAKGDHHVEVALLDRSHHEVCAPKWLGVHVK